MLSDRPTRRKLDHDVPSWVTNHTLDELFFITICCQPRDKNHLSREDVWNSLKETVVHRNDTGIWTCHLLLAMPDHLHGLFTFSGTVSMTKSITDWKRWTARTIGISWQDGFFDHRIRDHDSLEEKRAYIDKNPTRAGLVKGPKDWVYKYEIDR